MIGLETNDEKKDWIVVQSTSEDAIKCTLEYVQEIWSTNMWLKKSNNNYQLWAHCSVAVLGDIKCKAIAFRDGWNRAKFS